MAELPERQMTELASRLTAELASRLTAKLAPRPTLADRPGRMFFLRVKVSQKVRAWRAWNPFVLFRWNMFYR